MKKVGLLTSCATVAFVLAIGAPYDGALAQTAPADASAPTEATTEDIVVTGVRASQQRAVDIKRNAAQVLDAISAEDIGKLPDVTISDSLQRIPGVQVRRDAGEATALNIRGLPQVTTFLNGEVFLSANSITNVQPNFEDIPSQLISGAEVFKSSQASQIGSGITGTVNLKTFTPSALKKGLTVALGLEGAYGERTERFEPLYSGLLAWRNDRIGFLVSGSYSDRTAANNYQGRNGGAGTWAWRAREDSSGFEGFDPYTVNPVTGAVSGLANRAGDQNGDGDARDSYITYQGWKAGDNTVERERLALNATFEAKVGSELNFKAQYFHTDQTRWNRFAGLVAESKWSTFGWFDLLAPGGASRDTGVVSNGANLSTLQSAIYNVQRLSSYTEVNRSDSKSDNFNVELSKTGDRFSWNARYIHAMADQLSENTYIDTTLASQDQWGAGTGYYPSGPLRTNPTGYRGLLPIGVNNAGKNIIFSGIPTGLVSNLNNYAVDGFVSEGNSESNATLDVLRFDGDFKFSPEWKVKFGVRGINRDIGREAFDYAASLYPSQASNGRGCDVKWIASDVVLNQPSCSAGTAPNYFTALAPTPLSSTNNVVTLDKFGGAQGIPNLYGFDPKALDRPIDYLRSLYPSLHRVSDPGASYDLRLRQYSGYAQAEYNGDLAGIPIAGNVGVQVVQTQLRVRQNLVGGGNPYGVPASDIGDSVTNRSFTDVLPSLNIAASVRDNVKIRFAYSRNMTLLDAGQWSGSKRLSYANDGTGNFVVFGGSESGNPLLDPWRSSNLDLSFEWYNAPASLFSIGLFYINVDSFVVSGTRRSVEQNLTGGGTREIDLATILQGNGGTLKGVELNAKQAFTYLPGFLSGFGIDANLTYSPSSREGKDIEGRRLAFQDNSKLQTNVALWYQNYGVQARLAYNYRSKRVVLDDAFGVAGLTEFASPTTYLDASVSYDIAPSLTIYGNASNLTGEGESYYYQFKDQVDQRYQFERRFTVGVRAKF